MSVTHPDRRVRFTKLMIRKALFGLMEKKPLEKITVTEICAWADINRGTFYKYYMDVKDLFSQLENEYFNELASTLDPHNNDLPNFRYDTILNTIKENKDLTQIILMNSANSDLLKRLISYAKVDTIAGWRDLNPNLPPHEAEYIFSYIANGSVGMIATWLEQGMTMPVEDLCRLIAQLNNVDLSRYRLEP